MCVCVCDGVKLVQMSECSKNVENDQLHLAMQCEYGFDFPTALLPERHTFFGEILHV